MKIQFIVTGWHMNQSSLIDGLHDLEKDNEDVNVFWSCHKEPTDEIKEKFDYKLFLNGGEECGAYDQAIDHLDLKDETIVFFLHDDIIIKDWIFIHECIERLHKGFKVIGNCRDYTAEFDPFKTYDIGISEEFDGKAFVDYVKPENKHLFDTEMVIVKVRPSFICMLYKDVKLMGGFEPRQEALVPPLVTDGNPHYRDAKGLGKFGNLFPALVCYKMNKIFGVDKITHLSTRYLDSPFIYECGRGGIDPNNPIT
tara:strand:- start:203 stop:964 length:762 start_codon:yes stop_codon:yes gene_type:complete